MLVPRVLLGSLLFGLLAACTTSRGAPGDGVVDGGSASVGPGADALAPGEVVVAARTPGRGPCAAATLGSVLERIHSERPDLADIRRVYDPGASIIGDSSFVYAYRTADGAFALALRRGGGDCPLGCTENEYWYFQTDATCAPREVGHYRPEDAAGCLLMDGAPMWNRPPAPDPARVCNADNAPQSVSGTYTLKAEGTRQPCSAQPAPSQSVPPLWTMTVAQSPENLAVGTVTFTGTADPVLEGRPLEATFLRRRFEVHLKEDNYPTACPETAQVDVIFDFEGILTNQVTVFETRTLDCTPTESIPPYCKGSGRVVLTP